VSSDRLIFFAPNVGVGGGLVLLNSILAAWPNGFDMIAILDERARTQIEKIQPDFPVYWFESNVSGRLKAEKLLAHLSKDDDIVFCFHNLPPILSRSKNVICYVHNPNLVGLVPKSNLSGWVRIRCAIERFIFRWFSGRITRYFVQTQTMAAALRRIRGPGVQPVDILPFVDPDRMPKKVLDENPPGSSCAEKEFDFIYVSDGAAHKNHAVLFEAWGLLADQGVFPKLALTLHPVRDVKIRKMVDHYVADKGVDIVDLGQMPHDRILSLYGRARALIFPSYAESFGIPLIEAGAAGLPILAAEMDFVRDVCEPSITFDPHSPRSIARAARRFLDGSRSVSTLLTPREFIRKLLASESDGAEITTIPNDIDEKI